MAARLGLSCTYLPNSNFASQSVFPASSRASNCHTGLHCSLYDAPKGCSVSQVHMGSPALHPLRPAW